jgi:N-acetylneuraminic acid mutarotase
MYPRHAKSAVRPDFVQSLESRLLFAAVPAPTPYYGTPYAVGQVIQAEDYDKGGEGVAYHDTASANTGNGAYRTSEGVDIGKLGSNCHDVGWAYAGEWIDYTVNIAQAGMFTLSAAVANAASGGSFHVAFAGANKSGAIAVPNTGAWGTFKTISSAQFSLAAGTQVMRIVLDKAGTAGGVANFDLFQLNSVPQPPPGNFSFKWSSAAKAPIGRAEGGYVSVNGKLYVLGGYYKDWVATKEVDAYDPLTNKWTVMAPEPATLSHPAAATDGRYIYMAGGYPSDPATGKQTYASTAVWRYDTQTNTWSSFVSLPAPRAAGAMVVLRRQLHYLSGTDASLIGQRNHWVLNLDDANPKWVGSTPLPVAKNHTSAAVLNGKIYVVGGQNTKDDDHPAADVLMWDPGNPGSWSFVKPLPNTLSHLALAEADGKLIAIGGLTTGHVQQSAVWIYDPAANSWSSAAPLPMPLISPNAAVVGDELIVANGLYHSVFWTNTYVTKLTQ